MNNETFTCDCGFTWKFGRSGTHDCRPRYIARIEELEVAVREHKKIMGGEATKADRELWTVLESKADNI